jgi:hypothetical protein
MQLPSSMSGFARSFRHLVRATLIATALIIPSGVSQASVLYNFVTDTTSPGTFSGIPVYIEITNQAYADRLIDSWSDVLNVFGRVPIVPYNPSPGSINVVIGPDDALSGHFVVSSQSDTLIMDSYSGGWKGAYSTDAPFAPCNISNTCKFEGEWEITAVPEPTSLALFGAACVAATLVSRRRRRSA